MAADACALAMQCGSVILVSSPAMISTQHANPGPARWSGPSMLLDVPEWGHQRRRADEAADILPQAVEIGPLSQNDGGHHLPQTLTQFDQDLPPRRCVAFVDIGIPQRGGFLVASPAGEVFGTAGCVGDRVR